MESARRDLGSTAVPWAAIAITAVTLAVFLLQHLHPSGVNGAREQFGCCPQLISSGGTLPGTSLPAWLGLLTAIFLHVSWTHVLVNMTVLLAAALGLERVLGWQRFLLLYLVSGVTGSLVTVLADGGYLGAVAGASGAVNGVWAAWLLAPHANLSAMLPLKHSAPWLRWLHTLGQLAVIGVICVAFAGWYGDTLLLVFAGAGLRSFESLSFIAHAAGALAGIVLMGTVLLYARARQACAQRLAGTPP
jgi:membrane associated rhomboid family serine protease